MRKSIKKIAASILAATMVLGTMVTGFADEVAETPEVTGPVYSLVGSPELGLAWDPADANLVMEQVSNSVYKFDTEATADVTAEFKLLKDGADMGWNYQMQYGTGVFEDNATQFKLDVVAGDAVSVYANVVTGEVSVLKNGANVNADVLLRWNTEDENSALPIGTFDTMANVMNLLVGEDVAYSVVGDPKLGINWDVANAEYYAINKGGVYVKTLVATEAGDLEFKLVEDGVNMGWNYQLQYGMSETGDNKSQYKVTAEAGDVFEVTFVPATGDVTIVKNGVIDATAMVMWDSTDEWKEDHTWETLADAKANYVYADAEVVYSVVGASDLVGIDWSADSAAYIVPGTDGTYKKVVMATKDGDFEFKVIQDGPVMAWNFQMQLGKSEFIDNASQFRVAAEAGDVFEITFTPANGDLNVTKNGEAFEYLVRWATRDEDPADFLTKEEALKQFVNVEDTTDKKEDTTTDKKEDTTTDKKEDTTTDKKEDTTTDKNQATQTGDAAPVALLFLLVASVVVVTVVAKKKEA